MHMRNPTPLAILYHPPKLNLSEIRKDHIEIVIDIDVYNELYIFYQRCYNQYYLLINYKW